jgi:hypothetical protein
MSILWLSCDEKGQYTLAEDEHTSVMVYPDTFQHIMVPPQLNLPKSVYRIKSCAMLPCPVCKINCKHYFLAETDCRVAVCYTHQSPYMFYTLSYEED